jgi:hypothetical protein
MIDKKAKRSGESPLWHSFSDCLCNSALSLRLFGKDISTAGKEKQAELDRKAGIVAEEVVVAEPTVEDEIVEDDTLA